MCDNYQLGQAAAEEDKRNIHKFLAYIEKVQQGSLYAWRSLRKVDLGFSQDDLDNLSKFNKMKEIAKEMKLHTNAVLSTLDSVLRKIDRQEQVGIESLSLASKMLGKVAERAYKI